MATKMLNYLQSEWELKKQVKEEFCIDLKHFIWLAGAHLVNLTMMMIYIYNDWSVFLYATKK